MTREMKSKTVILFLATTAFFAVQQFGVRASPPVIFCHTSSSSLDFMIGTWLHKSNNELIEETWVRSTLDELTCIRIKRTIVDSDPVNRHYTIPTNPDQSSPKGDYSVQPAGPVKVCLKEKEIYSIENTARGGTRVAVIKLEPHNWSVEQSWTGCLDQRRLDCVSIKLMNCSEGKEQNQTLTYKKLSPRKVLFTREGPDNAIESFELAKVVEKL